MSLILFNMDVVIYINFETVTEYGIVVSFVISIILLKERVYDLL
jgi:hypothetical protein